MSEIQRIAVIGAGAFGTALAAVIAQTGKAEAVLIGRDASVMADLASSRMHEAALPGIRLPEGLAFSARPEELTAADIVLFVMPSQAQVAAAETYGPYLKPGAPVVICAKGIEKQTSRLLTDVLEHALPDHPIAMLSGPGFAADIAKGLPTAMAIAAHELTLAEHLAKAISGQTFRLYASDDRIGVQLGGALKNVLAIACGIVEGMGLGDSARAALIARGLAEMSRLVDAMGGRGDTVRGLSGLGDLVLTATSHQSRNLRFGIALGRGEPIAAQRGSLVEGAFAAAVAARLAEGHGIEMPITQAVAAIIDGRLDIPTAITQLMSRPITTE
ncbi:NAD(P)H-dependent glycerol-3-phosphate dehydrogenase [Agrobacterium albertimagni AOL15]|uniref:Glycerol-3-phosphate dehydrogenase [NAD(P)+] n=1 Tax=Agrobacterium albertimagni AOL15 TaxID=1156935 RepID=K2QBS8_9HYPH|nr:NAD(P)H-dependent glycerol-3-phosphate dehydrogenase [Agrobacterium albertimagni]EKF61359.1 NAD(P)H-dependent glycerol-3-phosphate dehydrogenase [Agrobacterium albertimagni AOL15]